MRPRGNGGPASIAEDMPIRDNHAEGPAPSLRQNRRKHRVNALLNRIFRLEEHGTSVRTEVVAGMTTFVAMAYIIFVNPAMLADCGMPREAAFASTVWAAALTTLLMGFWANMPVALAPGMGINAFFTYTMVLGMGLPWQTALGAVFISATVFLSLTVCGIRELIIRSIPTNLELATAAGIGMFIALIGLRGAGVVADDPATLVTLGSMKSPSTLLSLGGIALTAALMARGVKGSILIGIIATTAAGMCLGVGPAP
ncbi:MAG: NCS2 family permease, partial [Mailhella sp.]|nr:NCS2 family permease [Mailhella sp.]